MPENAHPTLDTVARAAGVSKTTASNAYNRPDQLSESTREAVMAAARELGYSGPSAAGRSLRRGMSAVVGALLTESLEYAFADPGMLAFLHGLAVELGHERRSLQLIPSDGRDPQRTVEHVRGAIVDAFVVFGVAADDPAIAAVLERRVPLVCVGSPVLRGVPCVSVDNVAGARSVAEVVLAAGHRRIGAVVYRAGDPVVSAHRSLHDRLVGYREACAAAGLAPDALTVGVARANTRGGGREAAWHLLDVAPALRPTALLAATDVMALGAIEAAGELGLAVPRELSIVGFDDIEEARRSVPPLTTVDQGLFVQGRTAARLVLALTAGEPAVTGVLPAPVVVRDSVAPVAASPSAPGGRSVSAFRRSSPSLPSPPPRAPGGA